MAAMAVVAITATERAAFKRCRRAWSLSARVRRGLEPRAAVRTAEHPAREALAVHYFPGMWSWDRAIVRPLVLKAAGAASPYVEKYVDWASGIDEFEPLRVEFDYDAAIPNPRGDGDLATPDGRAVRYQGRAHALVVEENRTQWLLVHRFGPWTDGAVLRLDEAAVASAWAWEQTFLDARISGILFNELTLEGRFRRTRLRLAPGALAHAGRQLAQEAAEMLDPSLALYPTPGPHCPACPFLAPCALMQDGQDAEDLLARDYRPRPPEPLEEGRLGGATWGMGRGAVPPRFANDDR
ncbi:MAG: hypothetical protein JWN46_1663 [Acidimicrobiales bacterium]|nr:hypothetical protein [Acidimicrobiales bacterium]